MQVEGSRCVGVAHALGNVASGVQHTPHVDVVLPFQVKHQKGVARQWPSTQAGQPQRLPEPWRTGGRVPPDVGVGLFQRVDEAKGCLLGLFALGLGLMRLLDTLEPRMLLATLVLMLQCSMILYWAWRHAERPGRIHGVFEPCGKSFGSGAGER